MPELGTLIAIAFGLAGLLCVILAVPLMRGRVAPNGWYGVRIRKAYVSDANWYALNRHGGRVLVYYGLAVIACGVAALFVPLADEPATILLVGMAPLWLLIPLLVSILRFAHRLPGEPG